MSNLSKARELLCELSADALLITSPENRFYFSSFYGTAGYLFITENKAFIVTDGRYTVQASVQAKDFELITAPETDFSKIRECVSCDGMRIAYEDLSMSVHSFGELEKTLSGARFVPGGNKISLKRKIKTADEIIKIKEALRLADEAFLYVLSKIAAGKTEYMIAAEIENYMRSHGAERTSFETICASGANSAMPHHTAGKRELKNGDFLVMDFGCVVDGYCSDITRTVVIGKADKKQREIYNTVLSSQLAAEKVYAPGVLCRDADKAARDIISAAGYGNTFNHSLGHGVGVEIHEAPTLSTKAENALMCGDVVTCEPGIYVEGFGGVRIEDMAVITENSAEIITASPKELIEI